MLHPYYRVHMTSDGKDSAGYSYKFKVPNRLGIFKFYIDYWRYGYTFVEEKIEVSVI